RDDATAHSSLRRLLADGGRFGDLAQTLRDEVFRTLSPEAKLPLLEALVIVERDRLEDLPAAMGTLWAILQISPQPQAAHDALDVLLGKLARHRDRAPLLRRRLTLAATAAERVEVLHKLSLLLAGPLAATGEAIATYREILAIAPGDEGALVALREIYGI